MDTKIPFVGPTYQSRSTNQSAQECINWYLEPSEGQGATASALMPTPGLRLLATIGSGPIRATWAFNSTLYVVSGNQVYSLNSEYLPTLLGTISTSAGAMSFSNNDTQVIFVDGQEIWIIANNILRKVTDPDAPNGATRVDYLDGYFVLSGLPNSKKYYLSNLFDGTQYDGLDFASAESAPGYLLSHIVLHRQIFLLAQSFIEVWEDTGAADFPMTRINNALIEIGITAPLSVAILDNTFFWLGGDSRGTGIVWRANGYQAVRISNFGMENEINSYAVISDAFAFSYQQAGHTFYVLTFPTEGKTWVYDVASQQWHRRAYLQPDGTLTRHRANCYALFNTVHIVGDFENGNLYALDLDTLDDNGTAILRLRSSLDESSNEKNVRYTTFQLQMQTGVGTTAGQGADPVIKLRYSNDAGHTWSNYITCTLGELGQYNSRAIWRTLGIGRHRVWEISTTDPVFVAPLSAVVSYQQCAF